MGLFDGYQFNPQSFGILGLPEWLRPQEQAQAAFNTPSSLPSEPAFDLNYSDYGGMRTPLFGQAPQQPQQALEQPQVSAAARIPQPAAQPAAQPEMGLGDRMSAGVGGFMTNAHTGPIGALLGGLHGFATGDYGDAKNTTIKALMARGLDKNTAVAASRNPQILGAVLPNLFGTKDRTDDIREFEYAKGQGFKGTLQDWMAIKRGGAGEYGMTPIWGTDKEGKPAVLQLGKSGAAIASKLPDGISIARDPIKVDGPTGTTIMDPQTRQVVGFIPKDVAGAAKMEAQGKVSATMESSLKSAEQTIAEVDKLIAKPDGISSFVGPLDQFRPSWTMGSEGREALTRFKQLKGKAFLEAYSMLKGGGAITEMEGQKAGEAMERMDRSLDEKDFMAALKDFRSAVQIGMDKIRMNAGAAPAAAPPTQIKRYNPATGRIE